MGKAIETFEPPFNRLRILNRNAERDSALQLKNARIYGYSSPSQTLQTQSYCELTSKHPGRLQASIEEHVLSKGGSIEAIQAVANIHLQPSLQRGTEDRLREYKYRRQRRYNYDPKIDNPIWKYR